MLGGSGQIRTDTLPGNHRTLFLGLRLRATGPKSTDTLAVDTFMNECRYCQQKLKPRNPSFCSNDCQMAYQFEFVERPRFLLGLIKHNRALRRHLIHRDGHQCTKCKNSIWNDEPIPLEVEHIDGNSDNCVPQNLKLLCPNCHAQTPTFKGRNRGNGRHARRQRYLEGKSY